MDVNQSMLFLHIDYQLKPNFRSYTHIKEAIDKSKTISEKAIPKFCFTN